MDTPDSNDWMFYSSYVTFLQFSALVYFLYKSMAMLLMVVFRSCYWINVPVERVFVCYLKFICLQVSQLEAVALLKDLLV